LLSKYTTNNEAINTNIPKNIKKEGLNKSIKDAILQKEYNFNWFTLTNNLFDFYQQNNNLDRMLKIITGDSKISLRIVDWFATNYAKKYYTLYNYTDIHNNVKRFKVYIDYKLKLKAYSKKNFDPFCRWDRISMPYKNGTCIETTIGQLNFFRWIFQNNILQYIEKHQEEIEEQMTKFQSVKKNTIIINKKPLRKNIQDTSINTSCFVRFD
jgi:hypothetical protein